MTHEISYDEDAGIVVSRYGGTIDVDAIRAAAVEAAQRAVAHGTVKILVDSRGATSGLSTVDLYRLPNVLADALLPDGIQVHRYKRAIVIGEDLPGGEAAFLENVMRNRAQNVRVFDDVEAARAWLAED